MRPRFYEYSQFAKTGHSNMHVVSLSDCTAGDERAIWRLAGEPDEKLAGHVACSFEGNGGEADCRSPREDDLARMGHPVLLPTPPFSVGRELAFDPASSAGA
jgi:hypothetical protein